MNEIDSAIQIIRRLNHACARAEFRQAILDVWSGTLSDPAYGVLPYYLLLHASRSVVACYEHSLLPGTAQQVLVEMASDVDLLNDLSGIADEVTHASGPSEVLLIAAGRRRASEQLDSYRQRLFPSVTWPTYPPAPESDALPALADCLEPFGIFIVSLRTVYSRLLSLDVETAVRSQSKALYDGYRSLITTLDIVLLAINSTHKLSPGGRQQLFALLSNEEINRDWKFLANKVAALREAEGIARMLENHVTLIHDLETKHRSIVGSKRIR